ncbi:MAG TPA: hypothetical protein VIX82_07750, partial [Solirubrobacteraceae bacterium]
TQSAIHGLVTRAFLRSLAGLDLAKSKVGRLAAFGHARFDGQQRGRRALLGRRRSRAVSRGAGGAPRSRGVRRGAGGDPRSRG